VVRGVPRLGPGERLLPVHPRGAVPLRPHEAAGPVGDGAVTVVREIVLPVGGAPDEPDRELGVSRALVAHVQRVALDPAVGEVHAEHRRAPEHGRAHVDRAGGVLHVDDPFPARRVAVAEVEVGAVDEGGEAGRVVAGGAAGIGAREVHERVELLDGGQAPVVVAAVPGGVQDRGPGPGLGKGHLVERVDLAVAVRVRALLPREAGDLVEDRQAAGAPGVPRSVPGELGVLAVEGPPGRRRGDLGERVEGLHLAGVDDEEGQGRGGGGRVGAGARAAAAGQGDDGQGCEQRAKCGAAVVRRGHLDSPRMAREPGRSRRPLDR
jgi:hypothetical protein